MDMMGFDLFLPPPLADPDARESGARGGHGSSEEDQAHAGQRPRRHSLDEGRSPGPGGAMSPRRDRNRAPALGGTRSVGGTRSATTAGSGPAAGRALSPVGGGTRAGALPATRRPLPVLSPDPGRFELQAAAESYVDYNFERVRKVVSAWLREP